MSPKYLGFVLKLPFLILSFELKKYKNISLKTENFELLSLQRKLN